MISRSFFAISLLSAIAGSAAGGSVTMIGVLALSAQQSPVALAPKGPEPVELAFELTPTR